MTRSSYDHIVGLQSREPVGAVLTIGRKGAKGQPIENDRFHIVSPLEETREHEAGQPRPWQMGDAPADYLAEQLGHIVGLEIRLARLDGKRKLSQHHPQPDREGAMRGLEARGHDGLAQAMRDTAERPA